MKKKFQVFVSSTYTDLVEERNWVMKSLLEMDFIPCGMELFPAADEDQWSLIKKVVAECDYYIVILGGRYGSLGPGGKSFTQLEYEYAVSLEKPVITFVHESPEKLPNYRCEQTDEGKKNLNDFRMLCQKKMIKYWNNSESLAASVCTSLSKLIQSRPAIGWIRANEILKKDIHAEDFFYTLDERRDSNFPELIKDAKSISILARTSVNLLSQYERQFYEVIDRGCEVKLLFISPLSEATRYVYGTDPEIFSENIRMMNFHLSRLKKKNYAKFSVKCIKHAPTVSLILIEKENPGDNFIIVQLYFLHSRISRDRPLFKISSTDRWYNAFFEEFDQLWNSAEDFT